MIVLRSDEDRLDVVNGEIFKNL